MAAAYRVPHVEIVEEITEERIIAAMIFIADMIEEHGPVLLPYFDRLERELVDLRRRNNPLDRVRQFAAVHTIDGGLKAIR